MFLPSTCQLLDGKKVSELILDNLTAEITRLKAAARPLPKLSVIVVGDNPASQVYVRKKAKIAQKIGMLSELLTFHAIIEPTHLKDTIQELNENPKIHGILVQLPLPKHLDTLEILSCVSPDKDVDGFHPLNLGKLASGEMPTVLPCTPAGIMYLLKAYNIPLVGKRAVVVGRSNIVGKPMALLLLQENATVTVCHSKTRDLSDILKEADIVVAAIGQPEFIRGSDLKPGAVVIDVGMNRLDNGQLVGDVHFASASEQASFITPVPGGVGPMTIAMLMHNTLALYQKRSR